MHLIQAMENELDFSLNLRTKLKDALRNMTPGYLVKKRDYYYWRKKVNGVMVEKYLGPDEDNPTVVRLKRKKYFQTVLKILDNNIKAMDKFLAEYQPYDPISVAESLGYAYQIPSDDIFSFMDFINPKKWEDDFTKSTMFQEGLTMTTDKGDKVRSKSEVIIANALFAHNIPFQYEPRITLGNRWVSPDFKLLITRNGKIVIWEHCGMMEDPEYFERAIRKLADYLQNGYTLWDDLIFTFDDKNHNIDSGFITRIIETCLM